MKIWKKLSALILIVCLLFTGFAFSSGAAETKLKFNSDGKFKILVFADCQDDASPYQEMIDLINDALDYEKPDFVVFTGDNIVVGTENNFREAARQIIQPLIDRDIPYAYTFGNHDNERGLSKEFMHEVYMSLGTCLTYDAQPSLNGFGNCNIPVYSSTGDDIAFNFWIIDSLTYADGGYDHVRSDQLEWYKQTSLALEQQAGHKVNSLMFQHIALPEIYNLLTESSSGTKTYLGKRYSLNLKPGVTGYLGEFPCPPAVNGGQFDALVERGDVLGVVTGHDHSNAFHGKYNGIGFLQMPGMSFQSYGDDNCRGYGVIELDEADTSTYSTHTVSYIDVWNGAFSTDEWKNTGLFGGSNGVYISEISVAGAVAENTARNAIINSGFTLIEKDLNADSGGQFIYMGYKTTTDPSLALRDIKFYIGDKSSDNATAESTVNGEKCTYTRVSSLDLNKGAGGDYIYAFTTRDAKAGPPIKAISFGSSATSSFKVCTSFSGASVPADLNAGAGGEFIYCYLDVLESLEIDGLLSKIKEAKEVLYLGDFHGDSDKILSATLDSAQNLIDALKTTGITTATQTDIDNLCAEIDRDYDLLICKVDFVDYNGSIVDSLIVPYRSSATSVKVPDRPSDEQYNYIFTGWDIDTSYVTSNMTVAATYEAEHYHTSSGSATCTDDEVCKFCGEILKSATGHGETELLNVADATCAKDGYTGDLCCTTCGEVITAGEVVPALEHKYGNWVYYTMPTVEKGGIDRATCSVCKKSIYRDSPKATTATVNNEFIYALKANLSSNDIKQYFDTRYLSVSSQPYNGKVMGTNSVVAVTQKNVTTNYTVVIFGDVNGDGWYDGQDAVIVSCLAEGLLTAQDVTEAEYMAADCNHDGVVNSFDVELLNEAGSLLASVDQDKADVELQTNSYYVEYLDAIDQTPETEEVEDGITVNENVNVFMQILNTVSKFFEWLFSLIELN